jgi:putative oxidoreductase
MHSQIKIMKNINSQNTFTHDSALLLLRGITGAVFAYHGAQKLFGGLEGFAGYLSSLGIPFPHANAVLAASTEFFGGIALLAGIRVSIVAVPLVITMLVACFAHRAGGFNSQNGGMEYPLTLSVVTAAIGLLGAGRFALGNLVAMLRAKSEPFDLSQREALLREQ